MVLLHAPLPAAERPSTLERGGWTTMALELRKRYRQVEIPASPGVAVEQHD